MAMHKLVAVLTMAAAVAAGPALAQTTTNLYRSVSVEKGKTVRLAVVTALKKDCTVGEVGGVRVITAPKNGQLAVRSGKLKTPASFRCPNVETPVQGLFYQSRPNFSGPDEVSYETRTPEGGTETYTVKITVTDKPGGAGAGKKDGQLEL
ncbi:4-aminobutyrate aminotransferase [Enterovirga aerilata]|uniref:4-aminobutyrate aminotransferase n=1 Tax=Enterovirga aerilata TaxID=2730920 RepID=A0A849I2R4_9HYPH|nr:4-aminobutyrate aminotransferase [Enterovirga sp. DB1703]NNM71924.1 4-aminobutyrate aminotransferase [Enterovirga sp. DB1703]